MYQAICKCCGYSYNITPYTSDDVCEDCLEFSDQEGCDEDEQSDDYS